MGVAIRRGGLLGGWWGLLGEGGGEDPISGRWPCVDVRMVVFLGFLREEIGRKGDLIRWLGERSVFKGIADAPGTNYLDLDSGRKALFRIYWVTLMVTLRKVVDHSEIWEESRGEAVLTANNQHSLDSLLLCTLQYYLAHFASRTLALTPIAKTIWEEVNLCFFFSFNFKKWQADKVAGTLNDGESFSYLLFHYEPRLVQIHNFLETLSYSKASCNRGGIQGFLRYKGAFNENLWTYGSRGKDSDAPVHESHVNEMKDPAHRMRYQLRISADILMLIVTSLSGSCFTNGQ